MDMSNEDIARFDALWRICHVTRHGVVDDVEIDLRHELLNPSEWQMFTIGIDEPPYSRLPPFIWFPWYGVFDKQSLRLEAEEDFRRTEEYYSKRALENPDAPNLRGRTQKAHVAHYVRTGTPECFVSAGDKIVVHSVNRTSDGDDFNHPHDSEVRFAELRIVRVNGRSEKIKTPIMFNGLTSIMTRRSHHHYFDKIYYRICQHFGVRSLEELDWDVAEAHGGFAVGAACHARTIEMSSGELRRLADSLNFGDRACHDAFAAWRCVDEAAFMGYLWAKAEAEAKMKPLAQSALRLKASGSLGGSKSGKKRQEKREAWQAIARKMAIKIRGEKPFASQDDIATEITFRWKPEKPRAPGHSTLKALVSAMVKTGELLKRQRVSQRRAFK
jgi:hypothetical protein